MYSVLAVAGYRSLRDVRVPLGRLTVVTGANGSGKSNLYRALRLLADCGQGRVVASLAREGGLSSALWAGPETLGGAHRIGRVEGTRRSEPISLRLGVAGEEHGYLVDLGLPPQTPATASYFLRDPEIKREAVFGGGVLRPATTQARRRFARMERRTDEGWEAGEVDLPPHRSMLTEYADPAAAPELWAMRAQLRAWRFYDGFRADVDAPARTPRVGTRTPVLADDGADLAAALATILEDGRSPVEEYVAEAFDGARLSIVETGGLFDVALQQPGMLRGLHGAELSDGTLRYLLWLAALLTPEPPPLMVLNEPETSLHPSLLGPLARLVAEVARRTQVLVVTHSAVLLDALAGRFPGLRSGSAPLGGDDEAVDAVDAAARPGVVTDHRLVELVKDLGETRVLGQGLLTTPTWEWGRR